MSIFRKYPITTKGTALFLAFTIFGEIFFPTMVFALTSGPSSPEFSSFEPVATTDMVDPFSGDFTYNLPVLNIPGADGGGYAMSLSYHSGTSAEEEASWVGHGWTLNAGAINRGKVGYPDEFKGVSVRQFNKVVPNWTVSAVASLGIEFFSDDSQKKKQENKDALDKLGKVTKPQMDSEWGGNGPLNDLHGVSSDFTVTVSQSIRYNNYSGIMKSTGFSASFKGMASLNMNFAGGNSTMGFSVSPQELIKFIKTRKAIKEKEKEKASADCSQEEELKKDIRKLKGFNDGGGQKQNFFKYMFRGLSAPNISGSANTMYPGLSVQKTHGKSFNFSGSIEINPIGPVGFEPGYQGNFNVYIPEKETTIEAYGYLHRKTWNEDWDDEKDVFEAQDYFIEGETTLSKTDKTLGIPFSGADVFSATGEGIMGGFRLKNSRVDHYYPSKITNNEVIQNIGIEFGVGQTIQVGLDVGFGFHRTVVSNWEKGKRGSTGDDMYQANASDAAFFEFMNDPGKVFRYTTTDDVMSMVLDGKDIDDNDAANYISGLSSTNIDLGKERSSTIEYTTFATAQNAASRLDKMQETQDFYNGVSGISELDNFIRELKITKTDGSKYIYGAALLAKNELNLTVGLQASATSMHKDYTGFTGNNPHTIQTNYLKANDINQIENNLSAQGDFTAQPYSNSFLITQILTADYIDVNDNGPDARDYGGWTKFTYRKRYGGNNEWYRHRAPYNKMYYGKGRLNNPYDQTASLSSGEKEVAYLKTIETKTHIACFVTSGTTRDDFQDIATALGLTGAELTKFMSYFPANGSNQPRKDGLDAAKDEEAANGAKGTHTIEQLNKIILFSKSRLDKPVSVTNFEYSNEIWKGIPNTTETPGSANSGKLTLKKVWTDTEGLVKARISPYKFEYEYFKKSDYPSFNNYAQNGIFDGYGDGTLNEHPIYRSGLLDNWGFNQHHDIESQQREYLREWSYQGDLPADFDPAAWQLKRIILPSGGEIHVQYEQKDYCYVQDKEAMTMVSINPSSSIGNENGYKYDENKYYLNLDDVGLHTEAEKKAYFLKIARQYFDGNMAFDGSNASYYEIKDGDDNSQKSNMLYFRFLYNLSEDAANLQGSRKPDFVEGYCPVNRIVYDNGNIFISLGAKKGVQKFLTPRRIAYEQFITSGNLGMDNQQYLLDNENIDGNLLQKAYNNTANGNAEGIKEVKKYLMKSSELGLRAKIAGAIFAVNKPAKSNVAKAYDPAMSAFKLVVPKAKRGGGVRVKRLLMYNPGIEGGEASIYGSEYIYKTKDGQSSGVATNEPGSSRLENALVDILPRYKQGVLNKLMAGRDKSWAEGPLGGHLYPGASIGHSRVVIKNIHSGKSSPGFVINEYITCKDEPSVKVKHTEIKDPGKLFEGRIKDHYKKTKFSLPMGMFNYSQDKAWITQGFVFEISDLHGKLKRSYTYNGTYEKFLVDPLSTSVYASVENEYTNEAKTVVSGELDGSGNLKLKKSAMNLGQEEDIAMYAGRVEDRTFDFSVELDLNFLIQFPIVFTFGFGLSLSYDETELSQHITSRVIKHSSWLKKTTTFQDGIRTINETLAFNDLDGSPIITRVSSAYDAPDQIGDFREHVPIDTDVEDPTNQNKDNVYYTMNLPAAWIYAEMGKKSKNSNNFNLLSAAAGSFTTHSENPLWKFTNDEWYPHQTNMDRVISATATEFRKNRFDDNIQYTIGGVSKTASMERIKEEFAAQNGVNGFDQSDLDQLNAFYYPVRSFTFIGDRTSANAASGRVYKDGTITNFEFFKWKDGGTTDVEALNPHWQSPSYVTKYSPNGQPLEEVNLLGIYSTVKLGYGNLLPIMSAANAEYESVLFEDYENGSALGQTIAKAHTGTRSLNYATINNGVIAAQPLKLTTNLHDKGARFKVWVRLTNEGSPDPLLTEVMQGNPRLKLGNTTYPMNRIATVGEWHLLSVDVKTWSGLNVGDAFTIQYLYDLPTAAHQLLLDDVCFHPLEAGVSMTVYNPSDFKVVAQLDDQHFAVIYEYNTEGALVRTIIETERGRKTVKEQQANSPKANRNE